MAAALDREIAELNTRLDNLRGHKLPAFDPHAPAPTHEEQMAQIMGEAEANIAFEQMQQEEFNALQRKVDATYDPSLTDFQTLIADRQRFKDAAIRYETLQRSHDKAGTGSPDALADIQFQIERFREKQRLAHVELGKRIRVKTNEAIELEKAALDLPEETQAQMAEKIRLLNKANKEFSELKKDCGKANFLVPNELTAATAKVQNTVRAVETKLAKVTAHRVAAEAAQAKVVAAMHKRSAAIPKPASGGGAGGASKAVPVGKAISFETKAAPRFSRTKARSKVGRRPRAASNLVKRMMRRCVGRATAKLPANKKTMRPAPKGGFFSILRRITKKVSSAFGLSSAKAQRSSRAVVQTRRQVTSRPVSVELTVRQLENQQGKLIKRGKALSVARNKHKKGSAMYQSLTKQRVQIARQLRNLRTVCRRLSPAPKRKLHVQSSNKI
jgi:hypothetical protein